MIAVDERDRGRTDHRLERQRGVRADGQATVTPS